MQNIPPRKFQKIPENSKKNLENSRKPQNPKTPKPHLIVLDSEDENELIRVQIRYISRYP